MSDKMDMGDPSMGRVTTLVLVILSLALVPRTAVTAESRTETTGNPGPIVSEDSLLAQALPETTREANKLNADAAAEQAAQQPGESTRQPTASADTPAGGGCSELNKCESEKTQSELERAGKGTDQAKQGTPTTAQSLKEAAEACKVAQDNAQNNCLESKSQNLQAAMAILTGMLGMLAGMSGSQDQCAQAGNANQQAAQPAQQHNAACTSARSACNTKCGESSSKAGSATSQCQSEAKEKAKGNPTLEQQYVQKCTEAAQKVKKAADGGKSNCQALGQNQAAGMAALAGLMKNLSQAGQCQEQVAQEDCTKNPNQPSCMKDQVIDCNKVEHAQNPKCICEKNPRAAGCPGANTAVTSPTTNPYKDNPTGLDGGPTSPLDPGTDDTPTFGGGPGSAGGGGLPAGGSAGGGGGRGGAAGGDAAKTGTDGKKLDTNILGDSGGGGGGRGGGFSGSGSGDPYGKYAAYLPKKDDGRGVAGKLADPTQISGSNGLSNWEKVRIRYKENRGSLISH